MMGIFVVTSDRKLLMAGATVLLMAASAHGAAAAGSAKTAGANATAQNNFTRDRNVSVSQRPHPDYQAQGAHVGSFTLYPKLTTSVESNDNIYAQNTNTTNDTVWHVQPELDLVSNWNRHSLTLYARGSLNRYSSNDSENTDDYAAGAIGRLDITRDAHIDAGASYSYNTEPRTSPDSPTGALEPTRYGLTSANIGATKDLNRLRLSTRLDYAKFNYEDTRSLVSTIDQDYRDRTETKLMGRADYAVSPDTALFLEVIGNKRDYRQDKPVVALTRDSSGVQVLAGANFELGSVTRGEIGLGYLKQDYDDPSLKDPSGFGARAQVEWFPTQLTTVTLTGSRSVEESANPTSAAYLSNNIGVKVDHELLRNVLLTASLAGGKDEYQGIDRDDKRLNAGLSGTYLMNRNVGVTVGYTYNKQTTSGLQKGTEFEVNKVGATLTLQF